MRTPQYFAKKMKYDAQRTVFRYAQKTCSKGFLGVKLLFLIKIENFYQKQKLHFKKILPARPLSIFQV